MNDRTRLVIAIISAILISSLIAVMPKRAHAGDGQLVNPCIFQSSFTATADTLATIGVSTPTAKVVARARFLKSVIISSGTVGATVTVYDSVGNASQEIAYIDMSAKAQWDFNVALSSGLTYTTSTAGKGLTFTWKP